MRMGRGPIVTAAILAIGVAPHAASAAPAEQRSELSMVLSGGSHPVPEGATTSVTGLMLNAGPGPVVGPTTVAVTLAEGLEFVAASGVGWTCSSGQSFDCATTATPAAGSFLPLLHIDVRTLASAVVSATLTNESDHTPGNNTATYNVDDTTPPAPCDVSACPLPVLPDGTLPNTGGDMSAPTSLAAIGLSAAGAILLSLSRRRKR